MSQPLNRNCNLDVLGDLDEASGELWVSNPFMLVPNGQNLSAYERNRLYLNHQGTDFVDASFASGVDLDSDSRAVVAADFNRDGAPDLLVSSDGGGPLRLFLNAFPRSTARVRLELVGVDSNRPAAGSRVEIQCGDRRIIRDVFAANSCSASHPIELLTGLGEADRIDRLSIRWPTGKTQVFTDLPVNTTITITEGQQEYETADMMLLAIATEPLDR